MPDVMRAFFLSFHAPSLVALICLAPACHAPSVVAQRECEISCQKSAAEARVETDSASSELISLAPFVSLSDLLRDASDLESLVDDQAAKFTAQLASSYDRKARDGGDDWFANDDAGNYVRKDGDEYVMMETEGPGVITRIWSAEPSGTLRIYLNGEPEPALEADMKVLLSGKLEPFLRPFAHRVAHGYNFNFPVGFQSGARVTSTADGLYYQVEFRQYEAGVMVESFRSDAGYELCCVYQEAKARLKHPATTPLASGGFVADSSRGEWIRLDEGQPGAVTWLELEPERTDAASLRGTSLEMRFDGVPAVRVPLGDFFGSGPGLVNANSFALSMTVDGTLTSRFVMPFARKAELRVARASAAGMRVNGRYRVEARSTSETPLYFRAGWTGLRELDALSPQDLNIMDVEGRGHYVGMMLNVANTDRQWWGEGDEKIYVDGERFPSHFGTGTEDYFGFGFCSTKRFTRPFHGQTRANPSDNAGFISMYRLCLLDRIPFQRSLRFDFEVLAWAVTHRSAIVNYDAVYYWYGDGEAVDRNEAPRQERWVVPMLPDELIAEPATEYTTCD